MAEQIKDIEAINSLNSFQDQNFALDAIDLLCRTEDLHNSRLRDLDSEHATLNEKISALKDYLQKAYKHIKSGSDESLDLSEAKEQILALWEEWKEELKNSDTGEYHDLSKDISQLDFSNLDLETLDDVLIRELEKIQRHHEFKFGQIPSKLRMYIELFSILVEILKEIPKKQDEVTSHMNRNSARG